MTILTEARAILAPLFVSAVLCLAAPAAVLAQSAPAEISFDTNLSPAEAPVMNEVIKRFEAENPNIKVTLNEVAYDQLIKSLPLQLETGDAPDIVRLTYFQFAPYFLDLSPYVDTNYWMTNMGPTQDLLKATDTSHPTGVFTNVTVTGAFINRTLFDQAGVPVPKDGSSWDEWADAAVKVAKATGTTAIGLDRTGHRLMAPAINMGAKLFDDAGNLKLVGDAGFKAWMEKMVQWNRDGTMLPDYWATGSRDPLDDFINGSLVLYYSGNWQISSLTTQIADKFDWQAIVGPCGQAGCTGMPGGGILVGYKGSKHPDAVAKFLDFFAREDIYRYWSEQTLQLPQHSGLVKAGLNFNTTPEAKAALQVYAGITDNISPIASKVLVNPNAATMFTTVRDRLVQAITGELSVDDAIAKMQQDLDAAAKSGK